ncbi:hypothetical protein OAG14_00725 [Akkermansiaceae bacterium]|nr:hypothetical protein [Akkermansiaceae bacterium]MDB4779528.1 hypothetical protein [Akkermansiaceae bacterium]
MPSQPYQTATNGTKIRCLPREEWEPGSITWEITSNDSKVIGQPFSFSIFTKVKVTQSHGIHSRIRAHKRDFTMQQSQNLSVPFSQLKALPYQGKSIQIALEAILEGRSKTKHTPKIIHHLEKPFFQRAPQVRDAANLIEPKDIFNFRKNLQVIPFHNQIITLGLTLIGLVVVTIINIVGVHDQFCIDGQQYLLSRTDSDGDPQSPVLVALGASGAFGAAIWMLIKAQLRRYMHLEKRPIAGGLVPGLVCRAGDLFYGKSRIDLKNIKLRVVACNQEKGQRVEGDGSNRRTVSFSNPVQGLLIFEKHIDHIAAGDSVERWFPEEVYFDRIFNNLLPPMMISSTHGLAFYWEIQLIHNELVDQELIGKVHKLKIQDFLEREKNIPKPEVGPIGTLPQKRKN